jgi:D-glycero-D-manno-heptose 1,7-bisphosphate phosphatase
MNKKAVFLDRDNTIIEDPGYISEPDQVKLLPGAAESIAALKKMGFNIVIVTNQSAVARGLITEETLAEIHQRLKQLLMRQNAEIDAIYYCPYHPEGIVEQYKSESQLRKPAPGMLLKAKKEMDLDLDQSWLIGDSYRDIAAGKTAGCRTILINSSIKPVYKQKGDPDPDREAVNIKEAVNIIKMNELNPVTPAKPQTPNETQCLPIKNQTKKQTENESENTSSQNQTSTANKTSSPATQLNAKDNATINQTAYSTKMSAKFDDRNQNMKTKKRHTQNHNAKTQQIKSTAESTSENFPQRKFDRRSRADRTYRLLEEVLQHLQGIRRAGMYDKDEFSLMKMLAGSAQIIVIFLVLLSLWMLLDKSFARDTVNITLRYATLAQLMAISLFVMNKKR